MLEYYRFKTVHDLFIKRRIEEAKTEFSALQRRYVSLCDENTSLKMQVQEYEDILYLARNLTFDGNFYWLETGNIKQGPFCPHCYNQDGLLVRLSGERPERFCSYCRDTFKQEELPLGMAAAVSQDLVRELAIDTRNTAIPHATARKAKVIPFAR